jgi:hypothetical protein
MADRNLEVRRANYKSKSQFNAADVSISPLYTFRIFNAGRRWTETW